MKIKTIQELEKEVISLENKLNKLKYSKFKKFYSLFWNKDDLLMEIAFVKLAISYRELSKFCYDLEQLIP